MKKFASLMVMGALIAPMAASADMTPAERNAVYATIMTQLQSDELLRDMVARDIEFMEVMEEMEAVVSDDTELPPVMSINQMRNVIADEMEDMPAYGMTNLHQRRTQRFELSGRVRNSTTRNSFTSEGRMTMTPDEIALRSRAAAIQSAVNTVKPTAEWKSSRLQRRTLSSGYRNTMPKSMMAPMY